MRDVDVMLPSGSRITVPYGTRVEDILTNSEFNQLHSPSSGFCQ
jgi:hypothetical protein